MTRIDDKNPTDRDVIREVLGKHPLCACGDMATIWIRPGGTGFEDADLFLCDGCAFHLARILMMDIGHPSKIVQTPTNC